MRAALGVLLGLSFACADAPVQTDGDQDSMELALEADALPGAQSDDTERTDDMPRDTPFPPDGATEQIVETLDCPRGGTVRVTVRRESSDDPYKRKGYLRWEYDLCGTLDFGTIDGNANYSRELKGGPPWVRMLQYYADLDYSGESEGACNAFIKLEQSWHTADHRLELASTCPHPVREWWGVLGL